MFDVTFVPFIILFLGNTWNIIDFQYYYVSRRWTLLSIYIYIYIKAYAKYTALRMFTVTYLAKQFPLHYLSFLNYVYFCIIINCSWYLADREWHVMYKYVSILWGNHFNDLWFLQKYYVWGGKQLGESIQQGQY